MRLVFNFVILLVSHFGEIDVSLVESQLQNSLTPVDMQVILMVNFQKKSTIPIDFIAFVSSSHPVKWGITPSALHKPY